MSRAERLFGLAQYLKSQSGRRLDEIARRFGVSERTVFRDLASLDEQGIPLEHLDGGRYRILETRHRPPALDSTDLALLRVALPDEAGAQSNPLGGRLARLIEKVESALRGRPDAPSASAAEDLVVDALRADRLRQELEHQIEIRRPVAILYRSLSGGTEAERIVDPWQLFERAGAWYLVGRCHLHDEPRLFRLDRIQAVRPSAGSFRLPEGFEVDRFLSEAWSTYVLGRPIAPGRRRPRR